MRRLLIAAAFAAFLTTASPPGADARGHDGRDGNDRQARQDQRENRGGCSTESAPRPIAAPAGATYLVSRDGGSRLTGPGLDGTLPRDCNISELGYNPGDGFLYGIDEGKRTRLVRIGRDGRRQDRLAVRIVGTVPGLGGNAVADIDAAGRLATLTVDSESGRASIQRFNPATGGSTRPVAVRWRSSCGPSLANLGAQWRLYARNRRLPQPPRLLSDWAFNPADGKFYGYAAIDALDPYLGRRDPKSGWTVRPLPDQVVAIEPATGAANCAAVHGAGTPDRGPLSDGRTVIDGAAFVGPYQLALYESGRGRRWLLDVSRCFSRFGCRPSQRGRSALASGDAAGNPYAPAQLTIRAVTSGDAAPSLVLTSEKLGRITLSGGQSRTVDLVPGAVTIAGSGLSAIDCNGGDPSVRTGAGHAPEAVRLTIRQQERVVCTFRAGSAGPARAVSAGSGNSGSRAGDGDKAAAGAADQDRAGPKAEGAFKALLSWSPIDRLLAIAVALVLATGIGGALYLTLPRLMRGRRRP